MSNPSELRIRRDDEGRCDDSDIARILHSATESVANAPRGRGVDPCMRVTELMMIEKAREQKACSLNDYRRYLGLKRESISAFRMVSGC